MRYIGKHNLNYKILDKFFKSKDKIYTRVVNSLSLDGFTITLFNFESPDLVGNPEFVSVQSQISLVPKSESDITSITSYAKCYPKL